MKRNKQIIEVVEYEDILSALDGMSLAQAINKLQRIAVELNDRCPEFTGYLSVDYDYDNTSLQLVLRREETDEEYDERVAEEVEAARKASAKERKQLEAAAKRLGFKLVEDEDRAAPD